MFDAFRDDTQKSAKCGGPRGVGVDKAGLGGGRQVSPEIDAILVRAGGVNDRS